MRACFGCIESFGGIMSSTVSSVAMWRRILLVAITALVGALAVSVSAPQDAEAFVNPATVFPSTKGWVLTKSEPRICPAIYPAPAYCSKPSPVTAYRWSGSSWSRTSLAGGIWVYAWPYADGWHWAWTQRTGWLAVRTSDLTTGRTCPAGAYC